MREMKILQLPVTAKVRLTKYLRNTLNHETVKIYNRGNFPFYNNLVILQSSQDLFKIRTLCEYVLVILHWRRNTFMFGGTKTYFAVQDGYFIYYRKLLQ